MKIDAIVIGFWYNRFNKYISMKNLVIGSEGFIGKRLCIFLEDKEEEVVRFDIKRDKEKEDARKVKLPLENIDRVYFLAWDVGGAKYLYDKELQIFQLRWNLELMQNVMVQLENSKIPFLFISSQLAEEHDTVYGATKHLGEVWTQILGGVYVRQWNVYGPIEEETIRSHVISDFVVQAVKNKEIKMLTTGQEYRQFIHVDDVCKAWYHAISNNLKGRYDVTSFEWIKIIDVANIIAELTGAKVVPGVKVGSTPMTPISGKMVDWQPSVKLKDGLKSMIDEFNINNK